MATASSSVLSLLSSPQVPFLTDAGIETHMIFKLGRDLRNFALFELLQDEEGLQLLERMYETYWSVACKYQYNLLMGSPTWRASHDHMVVTMDYSAEQVNEINRKGASWMTAFRAAHPLPEGLAFVVAGDVGPRGDGYVVEAPMEVSAAAEFHGAAINALKEGGAEVIQAVTMTYVGEAAGIAIAASLAKLPCIILFTVETDGRLPAPMSTPLGEAILAVDAAVQQAGAVPPVYYGINCAHPIHMNAALADASPEALARLHALRPNSSEKSHAELDEAADLDEGDRSALAEHVAQICDKLPSWHVVGGCCGCDDTHLAHICAALRKQ